MCLSGGGECECFSGNGKAGAPEKEGGEDGGDREDDREEEEEGTEPLVFPLLPGSAALSTTVDAANAAIAGATACTIWLSVAALIFMSATCFKTLRRWPLFIPISSNACMCKPFEEGNINL